MLNREEEWLSRADAINDLQGRSIINIKVCILLVLQEVIQTNVEKSHSVYVAVRYKSRWYSGLEYKLHNAGMSGKIGRLFKESYQGF